MALTLPIFPQLAGISYPVMKSPQWSTERHQAINGKKTTFARFIYPIYKYELPYEFLRSGIVNQIGAPANEYQEMLAFYNSLHGGADLFQFIDPDDRIATTQQFGVGDGVTLKYQLTRTITGSASTWADPVFAPTVTTIFKNAVALTPVTDYSVTDTGLVTFVVAPAVAALLTWTGTYNWICNFDEDTASFEKFMQNLFALKKINFSTWKF